MSTIWRDPLPVPVEVDPLPGVSRFLDLSPLPPPYPNPEVKRPEDAGDRDWSVLVWNLLSTAALTGFLLLPWLPLYVLLNLKELLRFQEMGW
jgi:hypothetical protein